MLVERPRAEDLALNALFEGLALRSTCGALFAVLSSIMSFFRLKTSALSTVALSTPGAHFARFGFHTCIVRIAALASTARPVSVTLANATITSTMIRATADLAFGSIAAKVVAFTKLAIDSLVERLLITFTNATPANPAP
jgi:hypothetical protein